MRLSPEELSAAWVALRSAPFNAGMTTADEVERVLKAGNEKHADSAVSVHTHIRHAAKHFQDAERGEGTDTETGCSHRAHGVARLVLALMVACKREG